MKDVGLSTGIRRRFGRAHAGGVKAPKVPERVVKVLDAERRAWRVAPDGSARARAMAPWVEMVEHGAIHPSRDQITGQRKRKFLRATGTGRELSAAERREYRR